VAGSGGSPVSPRVRIGDPERERLSAILREHYAEGRLTLDELRRRAEIVLAASYLDEASQALAELPASAGAGPGTGPAGARADQPRRGLLARRGHAESVRPAAGWEQTAERFRDPSTGVIMRVWVDPADGSRHYVPDEPGQ
jgi:hypothetical protein